MKTCPCGLPNLYSECCGRFIEATQIPSTPEELMRSRYTAYSQANMDYINRTMQGPAALGFDVNEAFKLAKITLWRKLIIKQSSMEKNKGTVEFIAYYTITNQNHILHEKSEFILQNGIWYYVDGQTFLNEPLRISRNDKCPCGSHKKFKKCCDAIF